MQKENQEATNNSAGVVNFNTHFTENFMLNEAFKTLRSNLLFCGEEYKKIVITSALEHEGKTTISTELAKSLADIDRKTLLIYGDMRKYMNTVKNLKVMGLSELLRGEAEISQVLYNTQNPNFDVIFNGGIPENPTELLSGNQLTKILEALEESYQHIIIDSPPLMPVIDASLIASNCDGAVLVIASEKATVQELSISKTQLERSGCKILGAILNQTRENIESKYYGKKYGYYNK